MDNYLPGDCPSGWNAFGGKCYLYQTATTSQEDAFLACTALELNAILAVPANQGEVDFLKTMGTLPVWIGITDKGEEGKVQRNVPENLIQKQE